jgi:hypothetical protein
MTRPDRKPDPSAGATGWASGSQMCSGTIPALKPNPASASTNTALRQAPGTAWLRAAIVMRSSVPVFADKIANAATISANPTSPRARNRKPPAVTPRHWWWRRISR